MSIILISFLVNKSQIFSQQKEIVETRKSQITTVNYSFSLANSFLIFFKKFIRFRSHFLSFFSFFQIYILPKVIVKTFIWTHGKFERFSKHCDHSLVSLQELTLNWEDLFILSLLHKSSSLRTYGNLLYACENNIQVVCHLYGAYFFSTPPYFVRNPIFIRLGNKLVEPLKKRN